jgi:type II secretory pathway pseudopilin PulG
MGSNHKKSVHIKGYTLIEVIVSAGVFLLALSVANFSFLSAKKSFHHQNASISLRQSARVSLNNMSTYLRYGQYIYTNRTVTIQGATFVIPPTGTTGGNAIVFAAPENGRVGNMRYTIRGYYLRDRVPKDPANPTARQIMMYEKTDVDPPGSTNDDPSTINLSSLSGGTFRLLADYVKPTQACATDSQIPFDTNLKIFRILDTRTVSISHRMQKREMTNMPMETEELHTRVSLRNNF